MSMRFLAGVGALIVLGTACVHRARTARLATALAQPAVVTIGGVTTPAGEVSVVPPGWRDASLSPDDVESVSYTYNGLPVQIQLPKDGQGGAAAEIMLPPFGSATGTDADGDGIVDAREDALAAQRPYRLSR